MIGLIDTETTAECFGCALAPVDHKAEGKERSCNYKCFTVNSECQPTGSQTHRGPSVGQCSAQNQMDATDSNGF